MDLNRIPEASRASFVSLMARDLEPEADMLGQIDDYMDILLDLKEGLGRQIDMHHAEALADRARKLLGGVTPMTSEEDRRLIQGAVRYFLDASEADRDFHPGGLVDDVEVMNAVVRHLLRTDLVIPL